MQTRSFAPLFAVIPIALSACQSRQADEPAPVNAARPQILREIPPIPGAILTDTTGAPEAERRSWLVQMRFDSVTAFYRRALTELGWAINNENGDSTRLDLYTRKGNRTLWLHAEKVGSLATEYTFIATEEQPPRTPPTPGGVAAPPPRP